MICRPSSPLQGISHRPGCDKERGLLLLPSGAIQVAETSSEFVLIGYSSVSDMPDRYIKRKGIIFRKIAEKGDVDQTYRLEKENRQMKERMEDLERDYQNLKKAFEMIMPVLAEKMEDPHFRRKLYEKKRLELVDKYPEELSTVEESSILPYKT
jgi:predicted DNA-binding transcriptional regulator